MRPRARRLGLLPLGGDGTTRVEMLGRPFFQLYLEVKTHTRIPLYLGKSFHKSVS